MFISFWFVADGYIRALNQGICFPALRFMPCFCDGVVCSGCDVDVAVCDRFLLLLIDLFLSEWNVHIFYGHICPCDWIGLTVMSP